MLEVRDLRLVRAIHEHGSLVRAARVLGVSQPALTRSLASLEAQLRGPLFERSRRGVIATNLGRAVVEEASDILGRLDRLDRAIAGVRGHQMRDLPIAAGAYIAETVGIAAAARMLAQHPTVRIRLLTANWADVPRMVIEREAPIGLVELRGFEADPALDVERLRPQPAVFVVRTGHPLTSRPATRPADMMAFPFVFIGRVPQAVQGPMAAAREAAQAAGALHPAFPALIHESPTVALKALRHSDAVAAVTVALALPELRRGEVVALPFREPWVSVHPGILRLRNRPPSEAEQAFLDLLQNADAESERDALAWCGAAGLPTDCG
jgi:DNA-binding transcriptional LysR family regulator